MKIVVLNGSPHKTGNTAALVDAFQKGATSAGHEVVVCPVGTMNIKGCLGCEYCHTKGEGACIQKDDMQKVYPELNSADINYFLHKLIPLSSDILSNSSFNSFSTELLLVIK